MIVLYSSPQTINDESIKTPKEKCGDISTSYVRAFLSSPRPYTRLDVCVVRPVAAGVVVTGWHSAFINRRRRPLIRDLQKSLVDGRMQHGKDCNPGMDRRRQHNVRRLLRPVPRHSRQVTFAQDVNNLTYRQQSQVTTSPGILHRPLNDN